MQPVLRPHWHIDYLRTVAPLRQIWFCYGTERREHFWAGVLHEVLAGAVIFPGFGSSDCRCESHLLFFAKRPTLSAFDAALRQSTRLHPRLHYFNTY
jgi:Uri superfamily endonuclease